MEPAKISLRLKWYKNYKNRLRLARVIVKKTATFVTGLQRNPRNDIKNNKKTRNKISAENLAKS